MTKTLFSRTLRLYLALPFFFMWYVHFAPEAGSQPPQPDSTLTVTKDPSIRVNLNCLFISLENYELAPLSFAKNDIEKFSSLLQTFYGCKSKAVVDWPRTKEPDGKPDFYRNALLDEIRAWAGSLSSSEIGVLYLAGHGLVNPEGNLCVPMINFDMKNYKDGTIPLTEIHDLLAKTKAKCQLILLDTCFSGNDRAFDSLPSGNAVAMAKCFSDLPKSATLAGSQEDQKSWIWPQVKHSLFTFWLIEAFRGNADLNNDRLITLDELYSYVHDNVEDISSNHVQMKQQNPVLLHRERIASEFSIPVPQINLSEVIQNLASQIDLKMSLSDLQNVIVPEFVTAETGDRINPNYGTLPKYAASKLISALNRNNRKPFSVFNENAVRDFLSRNNISPADLGTLKTASLELGGKRIEAVVRGRLNMFHANAMTVSIELIKAQTQETIGYYSGTALLTPADMGMAGASFTREPENSVVVDPARVRYRKVPEINMYVAPQMIRDLQIVNRKTKEEHPMLNQSDSWQIQIGVRTRGSQGDFVERTGAVIDNQYYIALGNDEEYAVILTNKGVKNIWAKVLVDGRNTLSQSIETQAKDLEVVALSTPANAVAPRVNLEEAVAWMLYGTERDTQGNLRTDSSEKSPNTFYIQGFYDTGSGTYDTLYPFVLKDADESLKNHEQYSDQKGLITIALCSPVPQKIQRGLHQDIETGLGEAVKIELQADKTGTIPGEIFTVCNIRYVSKELYQSLIQHETKPGR